jgi:ATP-dependent helicase/nuclease subunit A
MTVHGAKGLEAPIVFLPDTCSAASKPGRGRLVVIGDGELPSGISPPLAWPVKGAARIDVIAAGQDAAKGAEEEEHRRLLYVALTRPRDRLYVTGFEGKRRYPSGCWYDLINQGLADVLVPVGAAGGGNVLRYEARQTAPHDSLREVAAEADEAQPLPEWARRPAPRESSLVMPMAPSRLAPLDTDDAGEPVEVADAVKPSRSVADIGAPSPLTLAGGDRFLRGTLTHALLEHLPSFDQTVWQKTATAFLDLRARTLSPRTRASIAAEALAVLRDPAFADVFGPASQSEVPIVGEIERPSGKGAKLRISGQIDRLVRRDHDVLIIDYKTNRPPPLEVAGIPPAYLYQMASYRLVLSRIYTGLPIRAAILWTDGARLMPIPDEMLDAHAAMLWQLDSARLDG